ncbi:MAG: class IV adenylate cyclase [Chloroflexi bacterium]|nr:class IV adenylate cyclase [Chloroflexota bacterium]
MSTFQGGSDHELEVKFYLTNQRAVENRLRALDANQVHLRTYELNLRFDNAAGELAKEHKILRLRQDTSAVMTFKGPSQEREEVTARLEVEFQVSDFLAARRLLEMLGFEVCVSYEKYRTTYDLEGVKITLDEMPYGRFIEVEGPDPKRIQAVAGQLGLDWSARIMDNYLALFYRLKEKRGMAFHDLTFANFEKVQVSADDLGVRPADTPAK